MEKLRRFRQRGNRAPGHPEYGKTPGVEATTVSLGHGLANAVGMAIWEVALATRSNRPGHSIVDHDTYVLASDGGLEEGISSEAGYDAGHLRLGKLLVLYANNHSRSKAAPNWRLPKTAWLGLLPLAGTSSRSNRAKTSIALLHVTNAASLKWMRWKCGTLRFANYIQESPNA